MFSAPSMVGTCLFRPLCRVVRPWVGDGRVGENQIEQISRSSCTCDCVFGAADMPRTKGGAEMKVVFVLLSQMCREVRSLSPHRKRYTPR